MQTSFQYKLFAEKDSKSEFWMRNILIKIPSLKKKIKVAELFVDSGMNYKVFIV